ncbi:hypothetical protein Mapa_000707 [Marchantia paleacea]|nr:hypothetical protein Mapa_000707 [Marchantia paleacea]
MHRPSLAATALPPCFVPSQSCFATFPGPFSHPHAASVGSPVQKPAQNYPLYPQGKHLHKSSYACPRYSIEFLVYDRRSMRPARL